MDEKHWDGLAATFDRDVFNPVTNDLHGTFLKTLRRYARRGGTAADFGCGNGRQLPLIARRFRMIAAMDHSGRCVAEAARRCRRFRHVTFRQHDLTKPVRFIAPVDTGICINVAIMPDYDMRMRLLRNVTNRIRRGGRLFLVVPSMESTLYSAHRLILWNLTDHDSYREASAAAQPETGFTNASVRDGVVTVGEVRTKHYLREELELLLPRLGHRILEIAKMEYPWKSEFMHPPRSMRAPYPWDWLVVSTPGRKRR